MGEAATSLKNASGRHLKFQAAPWPSRAADDFWGQGRPRGTSCSFLGSGIQPKNKLTDAVVFFSWSPSATLPLPRPSTWPPFLPPWLPSVSARKPGLGVFKDNIWGGVWSRGTAIAHCSRPPATETATRLSPVSCPTSHTLRGVTLSWVGGQKPRESESRSCSCRSDIHAFSPSRAAGETCLAGSSPRRRCP